MIKIYVKLPHQGALTALRILLHESLTDEMKREFYKINDIPAREEPTYDPINSLDIVPEWGVKLPEWWYLGGAFVIEDLIELRNRDVIWKAESYDRTK